MSRVHKLMAKDTLNMPGVLRYPNGELTNSHEEAAKLLLDTHFPGCASIVGDETAQRFRDLNFDPVIVTEEIITPEKVKWAISSFKPYKSPGSDDLYPVILQKA